MIAPLLAALLALPGAGPVPPSSVPASPELAVDEERAAAWPEVTSAEALTKAIAKVRKARNEELADAGRAELVAIGAAAACSAWAAS